MNPNEVRRRAEEEFEKWIASGHPIPPIRRSPEAFGRTAYLVGFARAIALAEAKEKCHHPDWGYDESGEAYCHDCKRVVPLSEVPRRVE